MHPFPGEPADFSSIDDAFRAADLAATNGHPSASVPPPQAVPAAPAWRPGDQPSLAMADPADYRAIPDEPAMSGAPQAPEPRMEPSHDLRLRLPRGIYVQQRQQFITEGVVRELTGIDEEALGRTKTTADWFDGVVALGISSMGDIDFTPMTLQERQTFTSTLLPGEDLMVYFQVVRATFGDERTFEFLCQNPQCGREIETEINLATDFPVKLPADPNYQATYDYHTSGGLKVTYRLLTGADESALIAEGFTNIAEMATAGLARAIYTVEGKHLADPARFVRELSIRDRRALLEVIASRQPTIDLTLNIECVCGFRNRFALAPAQLFRS